mmetsp:Transcript_36340/g.58184  ORF Transcript_36340/g.58184 Transcript_36340/m.58184 type:complete len:587 (+) Transcript_36340:88-1848(+)
MLTADGAAEPLTRDTLVEESSTSRFPSLVATNAHVSEHTALTRSLPSQGRRERRGAVNPGGRNPRDERQQRRARRQLGGAQQHTGRRRAARYQQLSVVTEAQRRLRLPGLNRQVARVGERMASFGALLVSLQASALPHLTGSATVPSVTSQGEGAEPSQSITINENEGRPQASARSLAVPEQAAGHLVLGLLRNRRTDDIDGLRTPRARRLLAQLRRHLVCGSCFAGVSVLVGAWLFVRASIVLVASRGSECEGHMRSWLLMLVCFQVSGPLSVPVAAVVRRCSPHWGRLLLQFTWPISLIVLFAWTLIAVMCLSPPPTCKPLRSLPGKAVALQSTSLLCLVISFVYLLAAHPIILRLNDLVSRGGVLSEAASVAAEIPTGELPPKEECSICLGGAEDSEDEIQQVTEPLSGANRSQGSFCSLASEEDLERGQALQTIDLEADSPTLDMPATAKTRPPWRRLKCGHRFHEQCLFQWLRKAKRCPLCRCHMREVPAWRRNQLADTAATSSNSATSQAASSTSVTTLQHGDPSDASVESSGSADARPMTVMVAMTASSSCSSSDIVRSSSHVYSDSPSGCESQKGESS